MLTQIQEIQTEAIAHLAQHRLGHADAAGRRQSFKSRRDVDAIAQQVVAFDNDIAEIHTDAKSHAPLLRHIGAELVEFELDFGGASNRLDRTGELGNNAVAGAAENAPIMSPDEVIDYTEV